MARRPVDPSRPVVRPDCSPKLLMSHMSQQCWVQGTGSKAAGRKIPALRTSDPFWPFPITRDVYALPVWKHQMAFRINRLYVGNSFSHWGNHWYRQLVFLTEGITGFCAVDYKQRRSLQNRHRAVLHRTKLLAAARPQLEAALASGTESASRFI